MQLNIQGGREFMAGLLAGIAVGMAVGAWAMPRPTTLPISSDVPAEQAEPGLAGRVGDAMRNVVSEPYRSAAFPSAGVEPSSNGEDPGPTSDTWSVGQGPVA